MGAPPPSGMMFGSVTIACQNSTRFSSTTASSATKLWLRSSRATCVCRMHLVPRLTHPAELELLDLEDKLSQLTLTEDDDRRSSLFADTTGKLSSSALYAMLNSRNSDPAGANNAFWKSCAPPRVQFFGWLLVHGRIQCKANLLRRNIVQDSTCDLCKREAETASHLIFHCDFSASFWSALGFSWPSDANVQDILQLSPPASLPNAHYDTFIALCCWQLWKRRNGIIFRQENMNMRRFLQVCKSEAMSWGCRLPRSDRSLVDTWCSSFSLAM